LLTILKRTKSMNLLKSLIMLSISIWKSNRGCRNKRKKKLKLKRVNLISEITRKMLLIFKRICSKVISKRKSKKCKLRMLF